MEKELVTTSDSFDLSMRLMAEEQSRQGRTLERMSGLYEELNRRMVFFEAAEFSAKFKLLEARVSALSDERQRRSGVHEVIDTFYKLAPWIMAAAAGLAYYVKAR